MKTTTKYTLAAWAAALALGGGAAWAHGMSRMHDGMKHDCSATKSAHEHGDSEHSRHDMHGRHHGAVGDMSHDGAGHGAKPAGTPTPKPADAARP